MMHASSTELKYQEFLQAVETTLPTLIPPETAPEGTLYQAASYALLAPGKRLRPLLTLFIADAYQTPIENVLLPACAIELIHCYSLIHDDLPCMDDDDFRRGRPTVHKAFDEATALLAGDYLLTRAFELIAQTTDTPPQQKIHLIQTLAHYAGGRGMIGGQTLDIQGSGKPQSESDLRQIHHMKTAGLFIASALFGGILSGVEEDELSRLKEFGRKIGLAFQIQDDILDVTQSVEKHGSSISTDARLGKTTYLTLFGEGNAQSQVHSLIQQAFEDLALPDSHLQEWVETKFIP